jgi:hypothetical protein
VKDKQKCAKQIRLDVSSWGQTWARSLTNIHATGVKNRGQKLPRHIMSEGIIHLAIEEGRSASKRTKFFYFLSMSQQAASAGIIPNSAVKIFSQKQKEPRQKQLGYW